ncbi:uncharacterized protein LOC130800330 [Amaranthus tricolor]|uniref:uncharacterized protein LOC130800330 n=1 Tax=Amaranthus tricolor TaxID=29722 RepID=UPI002587AFD8|nr:uncharacterized protein LOC130800330 [Amaranthus tricolor]
MVSDSIINASIPDASKDSTKKKRSNWSAKLKQSKRDVRREQWLSQGKNKNCEKAATVVAPSGGGGKFNGPTIDFRKKAASLCKDLEVKSQRVEEISRNDSDSESSPVNSPTSSISGGNDPGNTYSGSSSSSCSFSFSSGGCCSGSMTEEEECEGDGGCVDDGCLDDWEAVADALVGVSEDSQGHNQDVVVSPDRETALGSSFGAQQTSCEDVKAQENGVGILGRGNGNCRAWRPDDAFRPQSLPNLEKQRSFPLRIERHHGFTNPWVRHMTPCVPTSCPICCEDLDLTDSSFLPCSCGFHLCLFCHKRIIEEDGRCPGCRKPYTSDPKEKETNVCSAGGSLTIRLARSCSMSSSRV